MKKIYQEGKGEWRFLKPLVFILILLMLVAFIWLLKYLIISAQTPNKTPEPTPSPVGTQRSPTPTPTLTKSATSTPELTVSPTLTPETTATPVTSGEAIPIQGDETCHEQTNAALSLLSSQASTHYQITLEYVRLVECVEQGSGIFVWEDPPRYAAGRATREAGTLWYASTFPHEACHSKQYSDGRTYLGELAETECLNAQYAALQDMDASQDLLDYVRNQASTKYWEVPYEDRWW